MKGTDFHQIQANRFPDTKPHYAILDGLRGVAALLVVWYHVFEGYAFAAGEGVIKCINHGYLAVDFFFILSGFVISYAYDDRWKAGNERHKMTMGQFFKRRLIRLHPMVLLGCVIGLVTFCIQGAQHWDGTHVTTSAIMLALLLAMFMIPAVPGQPNEVRGNGEMFPLNGPSWSLFFEYIGNILYALVIRRLPTKALAFVTTVLGVILIWFTSFDISGYGSFGVGWTLDGMNFFGGLLRMLFPFSMGMLIARDFHSWNVKGAFWICTTLIAVLLFVPYIDGTLTIGSRPLHLNGLFESFCIIIAFPIILWTGASGNPSQDGSKKICTFLGELSFPLYLVHYPFMYLFYAWLIRTEQYTFWETWQVAVPLYICNIFVAWICMRFYDKPVRKWLSRKM